MASYGVWIEEIDAQAAQANLRLEWSLNATEEGHPNALRASLALEAIATQMAYANTLAAARLDLEHGGPDEH